MTSQLDAIEQHLTSETWSAGLEAVGRALGHKPGPKLRPVLEFRRLQFQLKSGATSPARAVSTLVWLLEREELPESHFDEAAALLVTCLDHLDCPGLAAEAAERLAAEIGCQLVGTQLAIARCRFRRGDPTGLTDIEDLAQRHPTSSDAAIALAEARLLLGDPTAASVTAAVSPDNPRWAECTRLRCDALWLANDLVGASNALAELISHQSESDLRPLDQLWLAELLGEARDAAAAGVLEELFATAPLAQVDRRARRLAARLDDRSAPPVIRLTSRFDPTTRAAEPPIVRLARALMPDEVRRSLTTQASAGLHRSLASIAESLRPSGVDALRTSLDADVIERVLSSGHPLAVMAATAHGHRPALIASFDPATRTVALVDPASGRPAAIRHVELSELDPTGRGGLVLAPDEHLHRTVSVPTWTRNVDAIDAIDEPRALTEAVPATLAEVHQQLSDPVVADGDIPAGLVALALAVRSETLRRAGEADAVATLLAHRLVEGADDPGARTEWARQLVHLGRPDEALRVLGATTDPSPDDLVVRARAARRLDRPVKARNLLDAALTLDSGHVEALIEQADLTLAALETSRAADLVQDPRASLQVDAGETRLPLSRDRLILESTAEIAVLEERAPEAEATRLAAVRHALVLGMWGDARYHLAAADAELTRQGPEDSDANGATIALMRAIIAEAQGAPIGALHETLLSSHGTDVRAWSLVITSLLRHQQRADAGALLREALVTPGLSVRALERVSAAVTGHGASSLGSEDSSAPGSA